MSTDVNGEQHAMAKDPVCGMEVSPDSAPASTELNGTTYVGARGRVRLPRRDGLIVASDGREGLSLAMPKRPDLVVLDLMLPNVSG